MQVFHYFDDSIFQSYDTWVVCRNVCGRAVIVQEGGQGAWRGWQRLFSLLTVQMH